MKQRLPLLVQVCNLMFIRWCWWVPFLVFLASGNLHNLHIQSDTVRSFPLRSGWSSQQAAIKLRWDSLDPNQDLFKWTVQFTKGIQIDFRLMKKAIVGGISLHPKSSLSGWPRRVGRYKLAKHHQWTTQVVAWTIKKRGLFRMKESIDVIVKHRES